jgi:energy-coupling factor transport system ATP-binding protein
MCLAIDSLSHVYLRGTPAARFALRDITLDLAAGQSLGIAGASGSGKSTLLRHLNGLLLPTSGNIRVNGMPVTQPRLRELRRQVGLVLQCPEQQFFEETIFREIAFGLTGSGLGERETASRVRDALHAVGLDEELLGVSPFALSDGEKRRVAIAGVLVRRPRLVALDEPTAGLDPKGRRRILDLLDSLRRDPDVTLIIVAHDLDLLARLTDRLALLREGTLAGTGPTRKLLCDDGMLAAAGLVPAAVTALMMTLKRALPELRDDILTVEEARAELNRVLAGKRKGKERSDEWHGPGPARPRLVDDPPARPAYQNSVDRAVHGGRRFD